MSTRDPECNRGAMSASPSRTGTVTVPAGVGARSARRESVTGSPCRATPTRRWPAILSGSAMAPCGRADAGSSTVRTTAALSVVPSATSRANTRVGRVAPSPAVAGWAARTAARRRSATATSLRSAGSGRARRAAAHRVPMRVTFVVIHAPRFVSGRGGFASARSKLGGRQRGRKDPLREPVDNRVVVDSSAQLDAGVDADVEAEEDELDEFDDGVDALEEELDESELEEVPDDESEPDEPLDDAEVVDELLEPLLPEREIGRASCRERV